MLPARGAPTDRTANAGRGRARSPGSRTRSDESGTPRRPGAGRAGASGSGCRESGLRRARAPSAGGRPCSVLEEVLFELERLVLLGIGRGFGAAHFQVLGGQRRPQRSDKNLVALQFVQRFASRLRVASAASAVQVVVRKVGRTAVS